MPSGSSFNRIKKKKKKRKRKKKKAAAAVDSEAPVAMDSVSCGSSPSPAKRRVMVVADPGRESSVALQWTLSHAILEQDEIILLYVEPQNASRRGSAFSAFLRRPASLGTAGTSSASFCGNQQQHHHHLALSSVSLSSNSSTSSTSSTGSSALSPSAVTMGPVEGAEYEFLEAMRTACELSQPKVKVQVERVEMEGRDKAAAILSQTKILGIDMLVIGQRRQASSFLGCKLRGGMSGRGMSGRGLDTAEFLIENCKCLCVGVQKKGQNAGYLLNTKTHKNFWLLA